MNVVVPIAGEEAGSAERSMELTFARAPDGTTFISRQHAGYPFHVGRTLRFGGDPAGMATVYLQSTSGGLYEGERLRIALGAGDGAHAHVTTQASTIVHGMTGGEATHETELSVGQGALLEYLADPLILFPGARLSTSMRLDLAKGGIAIVGDSFLAHDPMGKGRRFGAFSSDLSVRDHTGRTVLRDRYRVAGDAFETIVTGRRRAFAVHGTMLLFGCAGPCEALAGVCAALDADAASHDDAYAGASALPGGCGVWMRALAADGAAMKRIMTATWTAMRTAVTGLRPALRRK